jgi:hypothetical protein
MKFSVAMTTYNGSSYLRQQLESIFAQVRLPDEIVVCDDCSTDETLTLLLDLSERAPCPMKIVSNESQLGSTKNFEQAIRLCSGEIIVLSDQDDIWRPHKLETIERRFIQDPELGLVFTNGDLIDQNGARIRGDMWSRFGFRPRHQNLLGSVPHAYDLLLSWSFMTGATMAFRSSYLDLCLPIPDGVPTFIHDRWIAVMIGAVARVDRMDEKLIAYRLHPQQQMGAGKQSILHQFFTPSNCSSDRMALANIRERLANAAPKRANPHFLSALEDRQRHLAARSSLSPGLIGRVKGVAREYVSRRYQRYPWGHAYAVRDLIVGIQ